MGKKCIHLPALTQYIKDYLDDIMPYADDFNLGQRYALVDVLEFIQSNCTKDDLSAVQLDFCIEEIYPLI